VKVCTFKSIIIVLSALALGVTACGSGAATLTPAPTRAATQTPWIIYMPVTTTPEPPTAPLLPTAVVKAAATPTRTPTRPVVVKPAATPTKPPVAPSAPAAQPTAAPACSIGTVTLTFPENGAPRNKGAAFEMKWTPPGALSGETDPNVGYRIEMESRRGSKIINGATVYISHNKYLRDGKFVFDRNAVTMLAGGDDATVTWKVTIVKASGGFDDAQQQAVGNVIPCGSSSLPFQIQLIGFGD
jgi:hypothetical protein